MVVVVTRGNAIVTTAGVSFTSLEVVDVDSVSSTLVDVAPTSLVDEETPCVAGVPLTVVALTVVVAVVVVRGVGFGVDFGVGLVVGHTASARTNAPSHVGESGIHTPVHANTPVSSYNQIHFNTYMIPLQKAQARPA